MAGSVFRQKNVERINSPESLNDYVKVTNPSVWIILVGALVLIVGALIFSAFGTIDTNVSVGILAVDGAITAYVDEADIDSISTGMTVKVDGTLLSVKSIPDRPVKKTEVDEYVLHKGDMEASQWLFPISLEGSLEDGVYEGSVTVEQISLISYIFN